MDKDYSNYVNYTVKCILLGKKIETSGQGSLQFDFLKTLAVEITDGKDTPSDLGLKGKYRS